MLHSELNEPRAPIIERLRALNAIVDQVGTDEERHELAAERDAEPLADPQ
ncbi:hypothetical protein [Microbacterium sp. F2]